MDYLSRFNQRKEELEAHERKERKATERHVKVLKKIATLKSELEKLENKLGKVAADRSHASLHNSIVPNPELSVKIPWVTFLNYFSENYEAWILQLTPERCFMVCDASGCRYYDTLSRYERAGVYVIETISHRQWHLCQYCIHNRYKRTEVLTRVFDNRPQIDDDTIITLDPFVYSSIKTIEDLLKLGKVTLQ